MIDDDFSAEKPSAFDDSKARTWPPEESYYSPESLGEEPDYNENFNDPDEDDKSSPESLIRSPEEEAELQEKVLKLLEQQNDDMFSSIEFFLSDIDTYKDKDYPNESQSAEKAHIPLESLFDEPTVGLDKNPSENNSFDDFPTTLNENGIHDANNDLQTLFGQDFIEEDARLSYSKAFDPSLMFEEPELSLDNHFKVEPPPFRSSPERAFDEPVAPPPRQSYGNKVYKAFSYSDRDAAIIKNESEIGTPIIALVIAVFLFIGYTVYQKMSERYDTKTSSRRDSRRPKSKKIDNLFDFSDKRPVWSAIKIKPNSAKQEREFIKTSRDTAGRDNPFILPDSVLKAIASGKARGTGLAEKTVRSSKKAYRALMIGVIQSDGESIALINLKEAVFEVGDNLTRSKVLKAAIRAMEKALDNTIEVSVGDYIANWELIEIHNPASNDLGEPFIRLKRGDEFKILNMGKAEELGIFDENNLIDDLTGFENDF
ncbi:MAG: hypothetical protein VKK32_05115 [Candidatus Melainabacteria bacterium]|nr:hypothetical protein [Candidatus Melainabacteria bacterium]